MKAMGLARLGKDAELRKTKGGDSVTNLTLAFTWGKKGADGRRPTQWVDASLWGPRAEALMPYLLKGTQVVAHLDEVRLEEFQGANGAGTKMVARVADIELVANRREAPAHAPATAKAYAQAKGRASSFDDLEDDTPF